MEKRIMSIRTKYATHAQILAAIQATSPKVKVISCPNPADAASPVTLHANGHVKSLGQSADYRHDLDDLQEEVKAVLVQSWWDEGTWYTTVSGLSQTQESSLATYLAREAGEAGQEGRRQCLLKLAWDLQFAN